MRIQTSDSREKIYKVSSEVKELFQYIGRYSPQTTELDTKLNPIDPIKRTFF